MKFKNITYGLLASTISFFSCQNPAKKDIVSKENPITKTLKSIKGEGILFGHQDDLAYGMQWSYIDGESDVNRVTGDYPALFGWELGGIELNHTHNLDSVPFSAISRLAIWGHDKGGVNTFSWHPYSVIDTVSAWNGDSVVVKHILPGGAYHEAFKKQLDKVATFFTSLKDEKGNVIPFIFRPWHEMDGDWFWWGSKACSSDEFKKLFRFTIEYLRDIKGMSTMAVAYSPDRNFSGEDEYLTWYPGDDVVDILGMDNYHDFKMENGETVVIDKLHTIIHLANEKNKLAALTETGLDNVTDSVWFTQKLGKVLNDSIISRELSYAMVWRNDPKVHFFFPYPGHPAEEDAKAFCAGKNILLLKDYKALGEK